MKVSRKRTTRTFRMARRMSSTTLFALSCGALTLIPADPSAAHAQGATTGAVAGTITDLNGALLPGASVTVTSQETGITRTVKANGSGEFRISELQPGTYTATVSAEGFRTEQTNKILVTVGSISSITPKLSVGAVTDKVEVTDELPPLHTEDNAISTTVDQNAIDNLPINGRRWSSFALLTPGVVANSDGFGLLSFRGISYLLNNNTVDGADNNQAYFSEERGRTRVGYSTSQVAVQEFQVNTSNYSAEYGRSAGGVINTVTKSGGNKYHGELFFYDRDNDLGGAINPYTTLTNANAQGVYVTAPYKPKDWRKQWGFGIGGPILHDKLFWFYAYDQERRNFPGTARASDPADTFASAASVLPASQTCTPTKFTAPSDSTGQPVSYTVSAGTTPNAAGYPIGSSFEGNYAACALAAAYGVPYQAGAAYYAQGLGLIAGFLGPVPRVLDQVINFPKLDYQINDRNRLSLQYNRLRSSSPAGIQTQASNFYGTNSFGNDFVKEDFGIARLATVINSSMVNAFLVQYGRDFEYESSQNPSPNELPLSNNPFNRPAQTQIGYNFDNNGFDIGKSIILERRALPDERRLQLLDGVTFSHGGHTTKFGLDYNKVGDYINNLYDENGNYSYDYSYDFIADYLHATTGLGGTGYTPLYYSYGQGFGSPSSEITTREYSGYLTDDWRVTPRLTLTLGVRYEYEYVPVNPTPNTGNTALVNAFSSVTGVTLGATALPQTLNRPDDRNNVGPRVGFALNVYGDGKTVLRGGYGLYYGRIINSNVLQTYLESGGNTAQTNFSSLYSGNCGPTFPQLAGSAQNIYNCFAGKTATGLSPIATPRSPTSTVAYLDPHLQNPQVHEFDLAVEQSLGHGNVFALTYMGSLARELNSSVDMNESLSSTINTTYTVVDNPITPRSGYVTLPHGGKPAPLKTGQQVGVKVFTTSGTASARANPYYGQILDIASNVNSSYHALAVQFNHQYSNGFSLLSNYTWAHALDNNPYIGTGVPSFNVYDPTNLNLEHGNSSLDIRRRFVAAMTYQPQTHFHGLKEVALGGWRIAPIVQVQSGLPYTPTVSGSPTIPNPAGGANAVYTLAYKSYNGSGSSANRIVQLGRNTYNRPKTAVFDLRVGKNFYLPPALGQHFRLEIFAEAFNVLNHQNITGISTAAYTLTNTTLTNNSNFGTYTNADSNTVYSQRQVEIAARLHF